MTKKVFLLLLFFPKFFFTQINCVFTETNIESIGYRCYEASLVFTSSVNTIVKGSISANNEILITPALNYSITILPTVNCNWCTEPSNGSDITPKKGGGKGKKNLYTIDNNNKELIIEKNPVDDLLRLSLSNGIIKEIIIFDKTGKQVKHKSIIHKTAEIDVSILPKGIYSVKTITDDNQIFAKQFIKY